MTTTDSTTISTDMLRRFETYTNPGPEAFPPGLPVDPPTPFTEQERAAISRYNTEINGIPDCFDQMDTIGFRDIPAPEFTHEDQLARIKEHFGYIRQWYEAITDLGLTVSGPELEPSAAMTRLLEDQVDQFERAHEDVRDAALRYFIGDAARVY